VNFPLYLIHHPSKRLIHSILLSEKGDGFSNFCGLCYTVTGMFRKISFATRLAALVLPLFLLGVWIGCVWLCTVESLSSPSQVRAAFNLEEIDATCLQAEDSCFCPAAFPSAVLQDREGLVQRSLSEYVSHPILSGLLRSHLLDRTRKDLPPELNSSTFLAKLCTLRI
jgi:hypothetical protein